MMNGINAMFMVGSVMAVAGQPKVRREDRPAPDFVQKRDVDDNLFAEIFSIATKEVAAEAH